MPIVPSRSARTQELLARLGSSSPAERDSAVAGLTLLGARVLAPLGAFLPTASPAARLAAVEVLEAVEHLSAVPAILQLVGDRDDRVALRALEAAGQRPHSSSVAVLAAVLSAPGPLGRRLGAAGALGRLEARGLVGALEPLATRLLDEREQPALRCAILDGLLTRQPPLSARTLKPLLERLSSSPEPEIAARVRCTDASTVEERLAETLASARLSDGAFARTTAALVRRGAVAIPPLVQALDRLGPLGRPTEPARAQARGRLHEALAALDTRVALFDLREAIAAHPRAAMPSLLRAASRVGDASVVPALARAAAEDATLFDACAATLALIAARERLRKTSVALKSVRAEHRAMLDLLWDAARRHPRRLP